MIVGASEEATLLRLMATLVERGWSAEEALGTVIDRSAPGPFRQRLTRMREALSSGEPVAGAKDDPLLATLARAETLGASLLRDLSSGARASAAAVRHRRSGFVLTVLLLGLVCSALTVGGLIAPGLQSVGVLPTSVYGSRWILDPGFGLALVGPILFVVAFFALRRIFHRRTARELEVAAWLHRYSAATAAGHPPERSARLASVELAATGPREACAHLGARGPELFEHLRERQGEPEACRHLGAGLEILGEERAERFLLTAPLWGAVIVFLVCMLVGPLLLRLGFGWMRLL